MRVASLDALIEAVKDSSAHAARADARVIVRFMLPFGTDLGNVPRDGSIDPGEAPHPRPSKWPTFEAFADDVRALDAQLRAANKTARLRVWFPLDSTSRRIVGP